jgi:DNA-binding GntR family transcriptional regulator
MDSLLSNRVYEQLYGAMLDGRLRPGDRLNRRQVSVDLGVSVAPVLEAMTQLEWEGFLETSPRAGTLVRQVTLADECTGVQFVVNPGGERFLQVALRASQQGMAL